jgi:hypothetical protein
MPKNMLKVGSHRKTRETPKMSMAVAGFAANSSIAQRKDGTIVEIRPGFRPRVLTKQEVEALKGKGGDNGA